MIDRRLIENFDWPILLLLCAVTGMGLVSLYSALFVTIEADPWRNLFVRQVFWACGGLSVMASVLLVDYEALKRVAPYLYVGTLILLALVLLIGKDVNGSRRWLTLAGVQFQPSELMKTAIVVQLATYFASQDIGPYPGFRKLLAPAALTALPVALILAEPDLGTAIIVAVIALTVILFMGIRWQWITGVALVAVPLVWPIWEFVLKAYQKRRILILLWPDLDPLGAGYHIRQSKIAIGSGMFSGKGFLNGTQTKLQFLPEKHTDFIFSVFAEEWGFLGSLALIAVFGLLIVLALRVGRRSRDRFGSLLVVGMTALIAWQALINMGMVIGLLPVVGIPLPFVSYGGSSFISLCFAIGVIESVSMRRFAFHPKR